MRVSAALKPYALLTLVFVVSRTLFFFFGIRFLYDGQIAAGIQLPDMELLRDHFWQTLFYLHMQPPLFPALVGICMKLFGPYAALACQLLFLGFSLAIALMLLRALHLLSVPRGLALAGSIIYAVSPSLAVYENWLFYATPTAMLVLALLWCVLEFSRTPTRRWALALLWAMSLLCLMRSSFHLLLFALPIWIIARSFGWKRSLRFSCVPLLLVLAVYAKNFVVFGSFSGSSLMGMNWAHIAVSKLSEQEKHQLFAKVPLRRIFIPPFYGNDRCATPPDEEPAPALPILYARCKQSGFRNFNHVSYLEVSRQYLALSLKAVELFPRTYAKRVGMGLVLSTAPAERYLFTSENLERISRYAGWYDLLVWGAPYLIFAPDWTHKSEVFLFMPSLTMLFLFPVCLMLWWRRCLQEKFWLGNALQFHALIVITAIVFYCLLVSSLFEYGENNRFRFDWEPLAIIVMAVAVGGRRSHRQS